MFRYRLRTLLIVLGVTPPAFAVLWFVGPPAWFLLFLAAVEYSIGDESPVLVAAAIRFGIFVFAAATAVKLMLLALN